MPETSTTSLPAGSLEAPAARAERSADQLSILVLRVAAGEEVALAELYEETVLKLYSLARLIVRNSEDAEEVVCDTFVQVWRSARQYDGARGSALAWMLTICRSRAVDRRRGNWAERPRGTAEGVLCEDRCEVAPDDLLQAFEQDSAVLHAMGALPPIRRRLVGLAFLQGLTHEEIARETGLPVGTVKSHIRRALASLRCALGERVNGARSE